MSGKITVNDSLFINEQASAQTDVAGQGQIWVKNTTPNELWFTDDAGNDIQLGTGGFSSKCSVYLSSDQSISTSTWTKIQFDSEDYDTDSEFDSTTNYRFTATNAGYYHIDFAVYMKLISSYSVDFRVLKNGTTELFHGQSLKTHSNGNVVANRSKDVYLTADDYIEFYVLHHEGSSKNLDSNKDTTYATIHRFA